MKKYQLTIRGTKYEVELLSAEQNHIEIEVNGTKYNVEIDKTIETKKTPKLVRSEVPAPQTKEKKITKTLSNVYEVKSPLPGLILKILVREGIQVSVGQDVLVMEAMKMENKIQSEKAGTVKSIKVREGDNILQDAVLLEIE
jgi:biotin carboxyl carrier protein